MKLKLINHFKSRVMTCAEANNVDLVEYLFSSGFTPAKTRGNDYWYLSPFRDEKEASFKINKNKNVWYDHGAGKGGTVIDFVMQYFNCDIAKALQKLSSYQQVPLKRFVATESSSFIIVPEVQQQEIFDENNKIVKTQKSNQQRPPFHLHENSLINHKDAAETAIEIIAAKQPITDMVLCRYLKLRKIDKTVADTYCHEIVFKFGNKDAKHVATRRMKQSAKFPIKLRVTFKRQTENFQTVFDVLETDWQKLSAPRLSTDLQSLKTKLKQIENETLTFIEDMGSFCFAEFESKFIRLNPFFKLRKHKESRLTFSGQSSLINKDVLTMHNFIKSFQLLLKKQARLVLSPLHILPI